MVTSEQIEIRAADGLCKSHVFRPEGTGPWPAVIVFMDGLGIRPAVLEVGERLAAAGYLSLVPDLFYRAGAYGPVDARALLADPDRFKAFREKIAGVATTELMLRDTSAFLDWLAAEPDARPGVIGVTGYCMGGGVALATAGSFPDRIAAAASFHGGNLATDKADSPHLLAPHIRGRVYIAGAIEDSSFPDEMKERLGAALAEASVQHTIETYPARHGWVLGDMPTHDAASTARHDKALLELFASTLGR